MGAHQNCHGLVDIDLPFYCLKCQEYEKDKKSKLHGDKEKRVNNLKRQHKLNRREALRMFYDDLKCILCYKSGGLMMKTDSKYYHPFCAYFVGRYHELDTMTGFRLKTSMRAAIGENECYICKENVGICLQCSSPACPKFAHPHCLWLEGTVFEQSEEKANCIYDQFDVASLKTSKVRGMFHAIGPGTNGWYFDDPALKMEINEDDYDIEALK